jgi:hypothetical protein
MLYFALRAFGFLITNINIKITIYCSPSLLSFSILSLLFLILSSISLPSSLLLPFPFSFSLSFRPMCSIFSLSSRHLLHLLSLFSFLPIPILSLLVPTSATRYHFPLSHTLSPLPIVLRFSYFLSSIFISVSLSLYLFIHLLLVHFLAGSSSYSLLLLENFLQFLLSLILSKPVPVYLYFPVSYFHPFSFISLSSLANSLNFFCVSLSSFVKSSSIYILSPFFPLTYSGLYSDGGNKKGWNKNRSRKESNKI